MPVQGLFIVIVVLVGVFVLDNLKNDRHPIDASSRPPEKILVVNRSCDDGPGFEAENTLTVGSVDGVDLGH